MRCRTHLFVLLANFCGMVSAHSAVTTFDDRTAFEAAVVGSMIVNDDFGNDIAQGQSITFDSGVVAENDVPPLNFFTDNSVTGGMYRNAMNRTNEPVTKSISWTFPIDVTGFGFDIFRADDTGIQVSIDDGTGVQTFLIYDLLNGTGTSAEGFVGFVGMGPFSEIEFTSLSGFDGFEIDDLVFAPIPLPAGFWLFGSALGLLGWIRRINS